MKVIRDATGAVINVGDWDYGLPLLDMTDPENPVEMKDEEGNPILSNPLPEGAIESNEDVIVNADGSRYVKGDYFGFPILSARQLRLGLLASSVSGSQVDAVISGMPAGADRDRAQIEWEYATSFDRLHPLIASVGGALNLTTEEIDAMWMGAAAF